MGSGLYPPLDRESGPRGGNEGREPTCTEYGSFPMLGDGYWEVSMMWPYSEDRSSGLHLGVPGVDGLEKGESCSEDLDRAEPVERETGKEVCGECGSRSE